MHPMQGSNAHIKGSIAGQGTRSHTIWFSIQAIKSSHSVTETHHNQITNYLRKKRKTGTLEEPPPNTCRERWIHVAQSELWYPRRCTAQIPLLDRTYSALRSAGSWPSPFALHLPLYWPRPVTRTSHSSAVSAQFCFLTSLLSPVSYTQSESFLDNSTSSVLWFHRHYTTLLTPSHTHTLTSFILRWASASAPEGFKPTYTMRTGFYLFLILSWITQCLH